MVIHKQPLKITDEQSVNIPQDAFILCVQVQQEIPCIWYQFIDTYCGERWISTYGTGHPMPDNPGRYIGTYQVSGLVFHVYEDLES